jgi:hypothetical protein
MPLLRWLVAGLSAWTPRSVRVGFVVDKVALGQVPEFFSFPLSISFHHSSPYSCHLGDVNKSVGCCSSERRSHAIDMTNIYKQ